MKRGLITFALAALTIGLLGSCSKINERIDGLDNRVYDLENENIASVEQQIAAINQSIADLETIRTNIQNLKNEQEAQGQDITALKAADITLEGKINDLKTYVDTELSKYATKDWANATFATLEQHQWTCDTIAKIDARIGALDAKLSQSISGLENSLKKWVNEQLDAYYTAAQMDAKLGVMQSEIDALKNSKDSERIDSLATELTKTKAAVDTAKANIRTEYKNAIDVAINKLDGEIRGALLDSIAAVNGRIEALDTRVTTLEGKVLALEGKVDKLLAMIQSVSITPAYSDGSVEAVDGILTLKCIVSPAEALIGMESLKDSLVLYADSVKVKTKATTPAYMTIKVSEASVLDAAQGAITLTADISEYLPKGEDKALTVAVNIKNGISDFTTEFVPVYLAPKTTFKAVYDTNGGANTLTFYYDANDHSGEGITVYDNLPTAATKAADWGYNDKRDEIKSVVIDASVAGYKGLTSTASMFRDMATATNISGAEYLDVSNVTDMSLMFNNFGGGKSGSPTTLNVVPDVSKWNTGNVTNMTAMFESYGYCSSSLDKVPDVSGWNTGNVTNMFFMFQKYGYESQNFNAVPDVSKWNTGKVEDMHQMFLEYGYKSTALNTVPNVSGWNTSNVTKINSLFNGYGHTSNNIDCTLDLSGWDLSKITGNNGVYVFNFTPKTFNVTIPAKTGGKPNEGGKWYYGNGTNHIAPPAGKTFTLEYVEIGGVKWATKNLGAEKETDYGYYFAWGATEPAYSSLSSKTFTFVASRPASYGGSGWTQNSGFAVVNAPYYDGSAYTKYTESDSKTVLESGDDAATALLGSGWRMPTSAEFKALYDACINGSYDQTTNPSGASASVGKGVYWCTSYDGVAGCLFCDGTNRLFFPAAGYGYSTGLDIAGSTCLYWSSTLRSSTEAYSVNFRSNMVNPQNFIPRYFGYPVRPVSD